LAVAPGAEQLEVADVVAAAVAERDAMVDVEASGGAAAHADAVTLVDACADLAPLPAALDLPSCLPVVTLSLAGGAVATAACDPPAAEAVAC
jgi:hypothetical protein